MDRNADTDRLLRVAALVLAVAAPVVVVITLAGLHSVWWTFALYQGGIALLAPLALALATGRGWRGYARLVGLVVPPDAPPWAGGRAAVLLGLLTAAVTAGYLLLTRGATLDADRLDAVVAGWGVAPGQLGGLLAFMALVNATAEELFWRGFVPGALATGRSDGRPPVLAGVILPALLYTSYHVLTLARLVGRPGAVVLMTGGILAAGLAWGELRRRTGHTWLPLASHGGAVIAYMVVYVLVTGN